MNWYHVTGDSTTPDQSCEQDADSPASATSRPVAFDSDARTATPKI